MQLAIRQLKTCIQKINKIVVRTKNLPHLKRMLSTKIELSGLSMKGLAGVINQLPRFHHTKFQSENYIP